MSSKFVFVHPDTIIDLGMFLKSLGVSREAIAEINGELSATGGPRDPEDLRRHVMAMAGLGEDETMSEACSRRAEVSEIVGAGIPLVEAEVYVHCRETGLDAVDPRETRRRMLRDFAPCTDPGALEDPDRLRRVAEAAVRRMVRFDGLSEDVAARAIESIVGPVFGPRLAPGRRLT